MDCPTTRRLIDSIPEGNPEWRSAPGLAAEQHLAGCRPCQQIAAEVRESDRRIGDLMTEVSVPEGLRERLLAVVSPPPLPVSTTASPAWKRHWMATALSLCLALAVGVTLWWQRPPQFTLTEYANSAAHSLNNRSAAPSPFDGAFDAAIPDEAWQSFCNGPAVGWDLDGRPGHDVAAYRIKIDHLRMSGWLLVVPVSRVSNLTISEEPQAIAYTQVAWRSETLVLICISDQGSIERLLKARRNSAA